MGRSFGVVVKGVGGGGVEDDFYIDETADATKRHSFSLAPFRSNRITPTLDILPPCVYFHCIPFVIKCLLLSRLFNVWAVLFFRALDDEPPL